LSPFKHPWRIVAFLSGAFVLNYVDRQVVFSIFPLLRHDLGFSDAQLGAAGTLFTWTYSLAMPFSGRLADIFPRGKLVMAALMLWSLATLATGLSTTIGLFFASRIAMGLSESLYVPAAIGLIAQAHPGPTRSRALSIHGFAQYTGITLGGWYGGWAGDHIGWRQGFAVLAVLGILYSGALMLGFRNVESARASAVDGRGNARDLLHSRCYITLCALFLSFCAMLWMLYAWLPVFVYERYGLSLTQSGLTATLYLQSSSAVGVLLGGIVGDALSRHHPAGRLQVVIWGLLGCAPFALATFAAHSLPLLKISACGFGLFAGFLMANMFSALYDVSGPRNYGLATGVMNAIGGLGAGSAILITGIWRSSVGIEPLMRGCLVLSMSCAVVLFFVLRMRFDFERKVGLE
jgi:MFS family permease